MIKLLRCLFISFAFVGFLGCNHPRPNPRPRPRPRPRYPRYQTQKPRASIALGSPGLRSSASTESAAPGGRAADGDWAR